MSSSRPKGLIRQGLQFSRLLAAEVCASAVVMLDTPCSEVKWRVLTTHSIRQFPLHFPIPCVGVCHHVQTELYRWHPAPYYRPALGIIAVLISASTPAITMFYAVSFCSSIQASSGLSQFGQDRFPSNLLPHAIACETDSQKCTTSGCQVAMATKLRTVESSICGF